MDKIIYLKHEGSENIARLDVAGRITFHDKFGREVKESVGRLPQDMVLEVLRRAGWEVFERLSA